LDLDFETIFKHTHAYIAEGVVANFFFVLLWVITVAACNVLIFTDYL